jgi:uncharacterized membrane protein
MSRDLILFLVVFAACAVEGVEAVTIVLAVAVTRGWRSAWLGVGAAIGVLAVIIAILGPALAALPLDTLRVVVGGLALAFGLQWLRKAILRAAGLKALHDEDAAYAEELAAARGAGTTAGSAFDPYTFTVSFKAVLLEGLEVAFIVVTAGANENALGLAAAAAASALVAVVALGALIRAPLSRVPENTIKFGVGVLLSALGSFWVGEGAGMHWPGGDAAIVGLIVAYAALALLLARAVRTLPSPAGRPV